MYSTDFEEFVTAAEVSEPQAAYQINRELSMAWDIVEKTDSNLFLTGRAGTGKTSFLRNLREKSSKSMVVLAPTGVAAINAAGNTIHSFFQLPFAPYLPGKGFPKGENRHLNLSRQKRRLMMSLTLLVIDEISMVRPDILDAIDATLRRVRHSKQPFGGVQLLLIGDLRQLPPVVKEPEWTHLKEHYASPYFFESHALKKAGFQTLELSVVYRQSDKSFIEILNAIRDARLTPDLFKALNERYRPDQNPTNDEGYIRLTTHNRAANTINSSRLDQLPGQPYHFEASVKGDFPESAFPADKSLHLKTGARVMFVKNDSGSTYRRFYNGMLGTVTDIAEDKIYVLPDGPGVREIIVEPATWENTRYSLQEESKDVVQETVGTFTQYPLQLAWAITIHKSQGLTFDKAIIDAAHAFAPGQAYVALSRCRSLEGLLLDSPLPKSAVITDGDVNSFMHQCASQAPNNAKVASLKEEYLHNILTSLFDFTAVENSFADFSRAVEAYVVPIYPKLADQLKEARSLVASDLWSVGNRFAESCKGRNLTTETALPGSPLNQRIQNGCRYFTEKIGDFLDFLRAIPTDLDNAEYAERLNRGFEDLMYHLRLKNLLLSYLEDEDFSMEAYHAARASAILEVEKQMNGPLEPGRKRKRASEPRKEKKPKGYSQAETLALIKRGMTLKEIAEKRGLKDSTIIHHAVDLLAAGLLKPAEINDPALLSRLRWYASHYSESPRYTHLKKLL